MYPFIDISCVDIDPALARRLSRRIAYYHLAIPIGEDADGVTVAVAHPDHPRVLDLLQTQLGSTLIPVTAAPDAIHDRLNRVWQDVEVRRGNRFLCLSENIPDLLYGFGKNLHIECYSGLPRAAEIEKLDLVIAVNPTTTLVEQLCKLPCSLLILNEEQPPLTSMLQIMRGHMPDRYVIHWLIPLAQHFGCPVRLLTGTETKPRSLLRSSVAEILSPSTEQRRHLRLCCQLLENAGVQGQVCVREGSLENAVMRELALHPYSLVAIAAEAHGEFAFEIWKQAQIKAFLVVKP